MIGALRWLGWVVVLLALAGCASTRFVNQPLTQGQTNAERRAIDVSHPERPLILVAVSGGGSRAAALGWAVLRELRKFRYPAAGESRGLIDDIGVVSSVSGGSVIAAHFALNGPQGLDRFEQDFLVPDNTRALVVDAANPLTWLRLAGSGSSRIDLVSELFDRQLFSHKTFAELNQPGKPYLILNTTDMATGEIFAITPGRFDDICANLDQQPISASVAASAAVPVIFSPVALQNYSATHCQGVTPSQWITKRLSGTFAPYINLPQFKLARYAYDLRHGKESLRKIDYLYLLDGGLTDNLGIHGLLETMVSPYAAPAIVDSAAPESTRGTILQALNTGRVKKLAVIVINARAGSANTISQSATRPGIPGMIGSVTTIPLESTTASVSAQMDTLLSELNSAGGGGAGDPQFAGMRVYGIQIDFDLLRTSDPQQRELREKANAIPTLWTISKENLGVIEASAGLLLRQHPCFQRLLSDMKIAADFVDPAYASTGCPQTAD